MTKDFLYDGSYEGLLTAIDYILKNNIKPNNISPYYLYQINFIYEYIFIKNSYKNFKNFYYKLKANLKDEILKKSYYAFLSDDENIGYELYNYYKLSFTYKNSTNFHLTNNHILKINKLAKKVNFEICRYLGILRFKELDNNLLYSEISPDNNIITILAKHFKIRLPKLKWIIHDKKRNLAILYDTNKFVVTNFDLSLTKNLPEKESYYQKLWKNYFNTISIKNRENKKLQQKYIPTRYWKYLIEDFF